MTQTNLNINELSLEAICKYDENSARLLYQHFYAALVAYSAQIIQSQQAAEDLVQDLFEQLWEKRVPFEHISKLKAYLYNATRNRSISFLRKQKNGVIDISTAEYEEFLVDDEGNESPFTEEVYRQLFIVIDELPERQRQVFLLLMEGHRNEEIAQILSLSVETVRTHRKRAIAFLREHFNEEQFIFLLFIIGAKQIC